jgi:hypothetical protein
MNEGGCKPCGKQALGLVAWYLCVELANLLLATTQGQKADNNITATKTDFCPQPERLSRRALHEQPMD